MTLKHAIFGAIFEHQDTPYAGFPSLISSSTCLEMYEKPLGVVAYSNGTSRKIHPREANSSKIAFRREVAFLKVIVADLNRFFGVYFATNYNCRSYHNIFISEVDCHYLHGRGIN